MARKARVLVLLACALVAGGASLLAAPAALGSASQVITDCNAHAKLTRHYSAADLETALNTLPADVREYTGCYDVIHSQLLSQLGSVKGGSGADPASGGSFLPTPLIVLLAMLGVVVVGLLAVAVRRRGARG